MTTQQTQNQNDNPQRKPPQQIEKEVAFDPGALAVLSKAEIDMQIATAHRFPRSVTVFLQEAEALVTLNEYVADECIYSLPARSGGDSDEAIEGPSSRFAEVILHSWGNSRAGARVIGEDGDFIVAQGAFHDLQKNVAISYEVRRRITNRSGRKYSADMIGVTANAACSIALRNAILKGVPKAFWIGPYEAARKTLLGDYTTLGARRIETLDRFKKFGVTPERIYAKFNIGGIDDLSIEHVFQLRGLLNAIKEGDTTPEEQFPTTPKQTERSATGAMGAGLAAAAGAGSDPLATKTEPAKAEKAKGTSTGSEGQPPAVSNAKEPGTVEKRDAIMKKIRAAKTVDAAADAMDESNLYEWTKPDIGAINETYNTRCAELA